MTVLYLSGIYSALLDIVLMLLNIAYSAPLHSAYVTYHLSDSYLLATMELFVPLIMEETRNTLF